MSQHALLLSSLTLRVTFLLAVLFTVPAGAQQSRAQGQSPPVESATEPQGLLAEPGVIQRAAIFGDRHFGESGMRSGFYTDFGSMIPGAGWLSGGPGYRRWFSGDRMVAEASAAISWRGYKAAQARVEMPRLLRSRLGLGAQLRWNDFTQIAYFGEGTDSLEANVSEYRLRGTDVVGYATVRPLRWLALDGEVGLLQPSIRRRAGTFKRNRPDTMDLFGGDLVYAVGDQPSFVHSAVSLTADTRDFPGHPTRGVLLRGAAAHFADRDADVFGFRRYQAEGAGFVPLAGARVVLALHGWLVSSDTSAGQSIPFYLQPSLGGHNTLRSYADYRFHDRHLAVVNAEARIAMMTHLDAAVFVDAGNVAARFGDLNLDRRSHGAGLRLHSRRQTFARLDIARGDEGWRVVFRLTDPLNLSRLSRRASVAPFVP